MIAKIGILLAAPFLLMSLVVGATGLVIVDVREGGPDGLHLVVPVPLLLAQTAMSFAPEEARYIECPEFAPYQDVCERLVRELRDIPDAVLVEVIERDETVLVRKVGNAIQVDVKSGDGEEVHCKIPLKTALRVIQAYDGHGFPAGAVLGGLRNATRGTLVHVKDDSEEVRVRIL